MPHGELWGVPEGEEVLQILLLAQHAQSITWQTRLRTSGGHMFTRRRIMLFRFLLTIVKYAPLFPSCADDCLSYA